MNSRFDLAASMVALAGLALFFLAAAGNPSAGLQAWLAAEVAWAAVSVGCLTIGLMRVLVGAGIDRGFGPALAAGGGALPLIAVGFIPVLLGLASLYPWASVPPTGWFQKLWLQTGFFIGRTAGYYLLWTVLALLLMHRAGRATAIAGLIVIGLTGSLASVDWMMSLEPDFHSSIYGMLFLSHACLVGWSLATALTLLAGGAAKPQVAAGYMIGGIAMWAYLSFCQYLVVWSGNEPSDIGWYLLRTGNGWGHLFWAASFLEGVLPFLFLMPARVRASRPAVAGIALSLVIGGMLDMILLVLPSFRWAFGPAALAALPAIVGLGGAWMLVFGRHYRKLINPAGQVGHGG